MLNIKGAVSGILSQTFSVNEGKPRKKWTVHRIMRVIVTVIIISTYHLI